MQPLNSQSGRLPKRAKASYVIIWRRDGPSDFCDPLRVCNCIRKQSIAGKQRGVGFSLS